MDHGHKKHEKAQKSWANEGLQGEMYMCLIFWFLVFEFLVFFVAILIVSICHNEKDCEWLHFVFFIASRGFWPFFEFRLRVERPRRV